MTRLLLGSCRDNQMRWRDREPTIAEILSDPIVRELMTADGVDERILRDQLTIVAKRLDNLTAAERLRRFAGDLDVNLDVDLDVSALSPAPSPPARGARSGNSRGSAPPAAHMD